MRLLLDSHAFLWFILGDQRLSDRARLAIAAADTDVLISPATLWEMAIKVRLEKTRCLGPSVRSWKHNSRRTGFAFFRSKCGTLRSWHRCRFTIATPSIG